MLHHEISGNGPPVLLIHGLGSRGSDWAPQVAALASRYRVLTVDLRGHGSSSAPPAPWTMAAIADDVAEVVRATCDGPVHTCGISLGGMVGFHLAVDHPALVKSLAIVNSGPAFPGRTLRGKFVLWIRRRTVRRQGIPAMGARVATALFPRPEQAPFRDAFLAQFRRNDPTSYLATLDAIGRFDLDARLEEVRCPVLAICGDRDYTPVATKEAWVRRVPGARLVVIPDSGHATPIDQAAAFNASLMDFLATGG